MNEKTPQKRNAGREASFNKRNWPEIYKNNKVCKKISSEALIKILGNKSKKLESVSHLANLLSYLILKSENRIVLDKGVNMIGSVLKRNSNIGYSEQLFYGFQKAYPKKVEYTLNKGLLRKDLKKTTDEKYQNAMLYIKGYINNKIKEGKSAKEINKIECLTVFTGALLPYFDETVSLHKINHFINTILDEAERGVPFKDWSKPMYSNKGV